MNKILEWIKEEEKRNIIFVIISGIALVFSLGGWQREHLPFDTSWIAIVLCGVPIILGAVKALIKEHDIKADVLVSMALIASVYIEEYFAAGEVAFIMAIGTLLEDATARKARQGIEKLIKLTPKTARIIRDGKDLIIPASDVKSGDILKVFAGETIAADGIILSGETSIDQSVMTGESIPVDKKAGDQVISGTLNQFGTFDMRATKVGKDSSLERMIQLAQDADANKAPIVSLVDKWATWMVIAALSISVICWLVTGELIRAVTVLVVFCPCAFILATPTAIMAGIGCAAKYGILIRSGDALERFSKIRYIAFDKTGTLTYGKPKVIGAKSFSEAYTENQIVYYAASLEQRSEHPLGKAILNYYQDMGGKPGSVANFELAAGQGIKGDVDSASVCAGKEDMMGKLGITLGREETEETGKYLELGATIIYISINGEIAGMLALADTLREDSGETIRRLKEINITPMLLTGDNEKSAKHIAAQVKIENVEYNLLPENKMKIIEEYNGMHENVCMIGDGINDALALSTAYAGVAMGGIGSDIAVEASDAVLVGDDMKRLPFLFHISKKVMRKININITFSMCLNLLAVILAMTGVLNPVFGALVHNCGSVAVVINSTLLLLEKDRS